MDSPTGFDLSGRTAFVTGASSGLGEHFAKLLAGHGARVVLAARRADRLEAVAAAIAATGGQALAVALDVTDPASVAESVTEAERTWGPIHVLVNNSGIVQAKKAIDLEVADWDRMMDTNLKGAWLVATEVARHMRRLGHGGSIVNLASIMALRVQKEVMHYCVSKAGIVQMTKGMAEEFARFGIRVNAIAPGYIETDPTRPYLQSEPGQAMIRRIPMRRPGNPGDLDGALLLLASDAGRYITGVCLPVDGGHTLSLSL
ncbi:MAG: SDR family NAD(P)-dependent oxidoreductase [Alphaproteobacteria bacterium]